MAKNSFQIGYCTNVHASSDWNQCFHQLQHHLPEVKRYVSPYESMGFGLWLSDIASLTLWESRRQQDQLVSWLEQHHLNVMTLNGFPYGSFHGKAIKENVYTPNWKSADRFDYTKRLIDLVLKLGVVGEGVFPISTLPLGYQDSFRNPTDIELAAQHLIELAFYLHEIQSNLGKTIVLALEPEPFCFLEKTKDLIVFFEAFLLNPKIYQRSAWTKGYAAATIERIIRTFLTICLDTCHMAVAYEEPRQVMESLQASGISVGKVQISQALEVFPISADHMEALGDFIDPVYLHQTVVLGDDGLKAHYSDLHLFLRDWQRHRGHRARVHFHVPVHWKGGNLIAGTGEHLLATLQQLVKHHQMLNPVFEVETYTFDVLPESLSDQSLVHHLVSELNWTKEQITREYETQNLT
ncbi:MAG: metabolite traffic protein EboE [Pseudobacteriovorax sp.]|nr:metabolite traffic protein EboE [Pseudobacteriovorax sp.]